jgi:ribosomal protein S18 acetylase RimI-like enzyme
MSADVSAYQIRHEPPDPVTYLTLRKAGGLSPFSEEAARRGLAGTLFGVSLLHDGAVIGMGRVVGDGGCFYQIVDIVVVPAHQGRGLGKMIMSALMEYLRSHAPKSAYVSLIADVPANALYEKFGFRETAPRSLGMALSIK